MTLQWKYAIRPSIRGNKKFSRDTIIKTVADLVGPEHPVDLKNYDLAILVDVVQVSSFGRLSHETKKMLISHQNVMSMSIVGSDYDQLKRFNLAELYTPVPAPQEA